MIFCETDIEYLKIEVKKRMSEKRYIHTLGVLECAKELSELCAPESVSEMACAALLHDVSKELSDSAQLALLCEEGIILDEADMDSPAIFHSFTAPIVVRRDFPAYATEAILSAVRNHTIGSPDMSVTDEIIFLADFIEAGRPHPSCQALRKKVYGGMHAGDIKNNINVLHLACAESIDYTITSLNERKKVFNPKNILTRKALLAKINK